MDQSDERDARGYDRQMREGGPTGMRKKKKKKRPPPKKGTLNPPYQAGGSEGTDVERGER